MEAPADPVRVRAVRATGLLDVGSDAGLDRVARLATRLLGAPTAFVSLVTDEEQVMPGAAGSDLRRVPRSHSLCRHVVAGGSAFVVADAAADERLRGHGAVTELGVRAYAGVPLRDEDGEVLGAVCAVAPAPRPWTADDLAALADLAEGAAAEIALRRAAAEAREAAQRLATVVDAAPMVLFALDAAGRFVAVEGSRAGRLRPADGSDVIGRSVFDLCAGEPRITGNCRRVLAGERFDDVVELGDLVFATHYAPLPGGGAIGVATDVTERHRSERRVAHLAYHDVLTGLPNRAAFDEALSAALVAAAAGPGRPVAVLSIDLDHFKHVNDELGRAAGDDLLRQAAARLSAVGRSGDLLARYGGDEFVLLLGDLPDRPAETAALVAERALAAFADPFDVQGTEVACGVSVGVAVHPDHGGDAETLLRHADVALHAAKHGGRRTSVVFDGPARGRGLATLAARLRRAVARGELVLHWQPMFDLERDCISGVEGLVRWQDPQAGLLPPGAFIPQAESTGVIDEIGDWVVDEACRQLAAWRADGLDPRVGFNVAPRQLLRRDFAARVAAALARHGLVAPRLTMEITESAAMQHPERTIPLLHELRANGVHLAIDDFGAHHSSLTRLLELPVDVLKLDRAFLRGVPGDPRARAFVAAILGLTRGIGVRTVVEGVETPEQLAFLRAQGARLAQGYHLARPADTATITALLRARLPALRAA